LTVVPEKGTLVPYMGTMSASAGNDILSVTLLGKARRAVLGLLFTRPAESFYLRQILRLTGLGLGSLQAELRKLERAGILKRSVRGNQVHFQANSGCPVFSEIKGLVLKTSGGAGALRAALEPVAGRISVAFVHGSVVRGEEKRGSDVDVVVVGEVSFAEVVSALARTQAAIGREVNPLVYSEREYRARRRKGGHFLRNVLRSKRVFIVGDERELERLAEKRLAA